MKQMIILLLASLSTGLICCDREPTKVSELDRFGRRKGKQFEATGFFRTEHYGERYGKSGDIYEQAFVKPVLARPQVSLSKEH